MFFCCKRNYLERNLIMFENKLFFCCKRNYLKRNLILFTNKSVFAAEETILKEISLCLQTDPFYFQQQKSCVWSNGNFVRKNFPPKKPVFLLQKKISWKTSYCLCLQTNLFFARKEIFGFFLKKFCAEKLPTKDTCFLLQKKLSWKASYVCKQTCFLLQKKLS